MTIPCRTAALLCAATLSLGACKPASTAAAPSTDMAAAADAPIASAPIADTAPAPTAVAPAAEPSADAALPNDVISEIANAPGPTGIDPRAMAGRFSGGGTTLTLTADGTYSLTEQDRTDTGTWTGEQNGRALLLDPDAKTAADRRYQRLDNDTLRPADSAGIALQRAGVVAP